MMRRNYVTVGFRALLKNRTYAFINIFGLAVGLSACLMLLLYVRYETSYDEWLPNAENVYQLQTFYEPQSNGEELKLQMSSYVSGEALQRDFAEVERRVYVFSSAPTVMRGGNALDIENGVMVDGPFFDIFQFPFVRGDRATALAQADSVVLSQSEAQRLFGAEDPVGKTLTLIVDGAPADHRVTGVFRDLPRNSHMRFNMIVRFDPQSYFAENRTFLTSFSNQGGWVYVALRPGTDPDAIQSRMPEWERRNIPDENMGQTTYNAGDEQEYRLVNARDVHLGAAQQGAMTPGNDRATIVTFAIIAALILFMACVNFTNLATARAMQRAREVAVRKVLGARRRQLMVQFLTESVLVASVAMIVALAVVELLLPRLSAFLDANLTLTYFGASGILAPTLVLILLVGALGGLYPAFYLSRFQPARVLKANKSSAETEGAGRLRNILVVAQFAVSIGLIICTAVVFAQAQHARTVDPGYKRDGLIQIGNLYAESLEGQRDALTREIARVDGVTSVGRTGIGISTGNSSSTGVQLPGQAEPVPVGTYAVDAGFFPTMGIRLLAGRQFDENRPRDDAALPPGGGAEAFQALAERGVNVVINRLAARSMGFNDPADAIGKTAASPLPGPSPP